MDSHHRVIQNPTTTATISHTALQYNFSPNFSTAVFSTVTNVVSSDITPISSLAPPQSLPSLSSLLFPSLPLPPRWSLIPIDSQWTDRTLAQPYVNDPVDVKLERSTSLATDSSLESSTRQKHAERDILVLRREGTTTGTTTTPGSPVSEACPSTASDCSRRHRVGVMTARRVAQKYSRRRHGNRQAVQSRRRRAAGLPAIVGLLPPLCRASPLSHRRGPSATACETISRRLDTNFTNARGQE